MPAPGEVLVPDVRNPIELSPDPLPLPPALQVTPAIPEPGTWALWLAGLAAVVGVARRRGRAL